MIDTIINILLGVEVLVALWIIWLDFKEVRFLRRVQPLLDHDVPLFRSLKQRAMFVSLIGGYLIVLTAMGALIGPLSTYFPPLRAINGALFLGLLYGPVWLGNAMRKRSSLESEE